MYAFPTQLTSTNISVRLLTAADAPALLECYLANRTFLEPVEPQREPDFFTLPAMSRLLTFTGNAAANDQLYSYGIWQPTPNKLLGRITISQVSRGSFQNGQLGYFVTQESNGMGVATAAVGLMVQLAFDHLELHRLGAATLPDNIASQRVLLKNGFQQEGYARRYLQIAGEWRDHLLFAALNSSSQQVLAR